MTTHSGSKFTRILAGVKRGEAGAEELLLRQVMPQLREIANAIFRGQHPGQTLQPTAMVNEAWIKLAGKLEPIEGRRHFLAVAGRAMRQVLVDYARARNAEKRAGGLDRATLSPDFAEKGGQAIDLVDLDDSLRRLSERNDRHGQLAELRIFGGLTLPEAAETLGMPLRTCEADWAMTRAWLRKELARAQ